MKNYNRRDSINPLQTEVKNVKKCSRNSGQIPIITLDITPDQIDASEPFFSGFGSVEREIIAQAIMHFYQERGGWNFVITADQIKHKLHLLGEEMMSHKDYNLEDNIPFDGATCPNVGDGRLLQKIAENTYAPTDLFIETCYKVSPAKNTL